MLASTMQHSTHNHTPTRTDHHHTHTHPPRSDRDALDDPDQEQPKEHTTRVSPQDPTACRTPETRKAPDNHESATLRSTQPHPRNQHERHGIKEKENQHPTRGAGQPHHTVRLLRKEVIQPHLPVRLPCYDFVPIASPTFDNSLPRRG
jgi:hypothetical protein